MLQSLRVPEKKLELLFYIVGLILGSIGITLYYLPFSIVLGSTVFRGVNFPFLFRYLETLKHSELSHSIVSQVEREIYIALLFRVVIPVIIGLFFIGLGTFTHIYFHKGIYCPFCKSHVSATLFCPCCKRPLLHLIDAEYLRDFDL